MKYFTLSLLAFTAVTTSSSAFISNRDFFKLKPSYFKPVLASSRNFPKWSKEAAASTWRMRQQQQQHLAQPEKCNGARLDFCARDEFLLQAYPDDRCFWQVKVLSGMTLKLSCEAVLLPCQERKYAILTFSDPETDELLTMDYYCNDEPEDDVSFSMPIMGFDYLLDIEVNGGFATCSVKRYGDGDCYDDDDGGGDDDGGRVQPTFCGLTKFNAKIVGGEEARPNEFPWMVALYLGPYFCGGTVINSRWIMTAAHCTDGIHRSEMSIHLGCSDHHSDGCSEKRGVSQVHLHPDWIGAFADDVSLLKMDSPVHLDYTINAACLPTRPCPVNGYSLRVAGWGLTEDYGDRISDTLKKAEVKTKPDSECQFSYPAEDFICAEQVDGSSCNGDSGSFVGNVRYGRYEQDGIVSFGGEKCSAYDLGFSEVYNYVDWIEETIREN